MTPCSSIKSSKNCFFFCAFVVAFVFGTKNLFAGMDPDALPLPKGMIDASCASTIVAAYAASQTQGDSMFHRLLSEDFSKRPQSAQLSVLHHAYQQGGDVNAVNSDGDTVLMHLLHLLKFQIDPKIRSNGKIAVPLIYRAFVRGQTHWVEWITDGYLLPRFKSGEPEYPTSLPLVEFMVKSRADINYVHPMRGSALSMALQVWPRPLREHLEIHVRYPGYQGIPVADLEVARYLLSRSDLKPPADHIQDIVAGYRDSELRAPRELPRDILESLLSLTLRNSP